MPYPYGDSPIRVYYSLNASSVSPQTSGFEVIANAAGKGINILSYEAVESGNQGGMVVVPTSTVILDGFVLPVNPAWSSDTGANAQTDTIVQEGTQISGGVASPPNFWMFLGPDAMMNAKSGGRDSVFVAPGFKAVFLQSVVSVPFAADIAVGEL